MNSEKKVEEGMGKGTSISIESLLRKRLKFPRRNICRLIFF
jgi:hypothetical protein